MAYQYAWKECSRLSEQIAKRGNSNRARPRTCRNRLKDRASECSPLSTSPEDPALERFPITVNPLIDKESLNIPIDGEGEKRPPAGQLGTGQLGNSRLVRRKEQLRPLGAIPI